MEEKDGFKELEKKRARKGRPQLGQKTMPLLFFFFSSVSFSLKVLGKFLNLVAFYSSIEIKEYYSAY